MDTTSERGGRKGTLTPTPSTLRPQEHLSRQSSLTLTPDAQVREKIVRAQKLALQTLDISALMLSSVPSELATLNRLTRLYLSYNHLENVPPEVCSLTNLEELDLSHNRIKNLPPILWKLQNLKRLRLSENQIRFVPVGIALMTSLRTLNLYGNELNFLPSDLREMTWLQDLYIGRNSLHASVHEGKEMQGIGGYINFKKFAQLRSTGVTSLAFDKKIEPIGQTLQKLLVVDTWIWGGCSDGTIKLWKQTGEHVKDWKGHERRIYTMLYLEGQGMVLTGAEDQFLHVWSAKDQTLLSKTKTEALVLSSHVIASSDKNNPRIYFGTTNASILVGRIRKRDKQFEVEQKIQVPGATIVACIELAGDELWVGSEKQIIVLKASDHTLLHSWRAHDRGISGFLLGKNEMWSASQDSSVRVWEVKTKKLLKTLLKHQNPINCIIPVRDTIWTGSWDKSICVWKQAEPFDLLRDFTRHSDAVMTLVEAVKGKEVWSGSTSKDNSICVWKWE